MTIDLWIERGRYVLIRPSAAFAVPVVGFPWDDARAVHALTADVLGLLDTTPCASLVLDQVDEIGYGLIDWAMRLWGECQDRGGLLTLVDCPPKALAVVCVMGVERILPYLSSDENERRMEELCRTRLRAA